MKEKLAGIISITAVAVFGCDVAHAYMNKPINKLTEPVKIVVPRGMIQHREERIYTPDRYHCYMRKTLKYCVDNHGRALNGRIVTTYDDEVSYETYQNGYQSGITSTFSENGTLLKRSEYRKGVKDGEEFRYYHNGNVEYVLHFDDGALDGRVEQYDISGALLGKFVYKKGWFREGFCKNEASNHSMHERLKKAKYNQIIPCGSGE